MLFDYIVALKVRRNISPTDACVLAYWACNAGAVGPVGRLGKPPGDEHTGHSSRKFDSCTGIDTPDPAHYIVSVPAYAQHKVVREALPEVVVSLALYLDGIQYAVRDSTLGIFIINLATQKRHLVCRLRKKHFCRCGCLGWCSLCPIFQFLHWCFCCLAKGQSPTVRHDQRPFGESDEGRTSVAGQALGFRAALLFIKAALAEYAHSLGFPSTAQHTHPCFLCKAEFGSLVVLVGWDALSLPWPRKTVQDYEEACARCEQWRVLTNKDVHTQLRGLLDFDKRKTPSVARGLSMKENFPRLQLLQGDRLEPSESLLDIRLF